MECSVVSLAYHFYLDRAGKIVHAGIDLRESVENEWLCLEILRPAMLSAEKEILRYFKDVDNNLDEEIKAELFTSYICDDNNQIDN